MRDFWQSPSHLISHARNMQSFWKQRNDRMDDWYNLYNMYDANQDSKPAGRQRHYSNEPRTLANVCINLLATNPPRLRIGINNEQKEERDLISNVERFFYGALNDIDEQRAAKMEHKLQRSMAFYSVVSGWICGRFVMTDQHQPSPIDHQLYDPYTVFPEIGAAGLRSVSQVSKLLLGEVADYWGLDVDDEDVAQEATVYDVWDTEKNAVVCEWQSKKGRAGNKEWAKAPSSHGLKRIPWRCIPVNGAPLRRDVKGPISSAYDGANTGYVRDGGAGAAAAKRLTHWTANMGQAIFASNEKHYPQYNEMVSMVMQVVSNEAYGTWILKTRDGKLFEVDIGNNVVNPLRLEEHLEKINPGVAPPDTSRILTLYGSQIQRGGIPFSVYGELPFEISGYLNNQLTNAAMLVLGPFIEGMILYYDWLFAEMQQQFMEGNFKNMALKGVDSRNTLFEITYDSDTQTKRYFGEIKLQPALPSDLAGRVEMASKLRNAKYPMASVQTIFDKILEWEDPDGEAAKIFDDMANQEPMVVLERMAQALDQRGLPEVAQVIRERAFKTRFMEEMQLNQAKMAMGGGAPGGGPGGPGMNPATLPPEAAGVMTEGGAPQPSVSPADARAQLARLGLAGPNG